MRLIDEEELEMKTQKNKRIKRLIIILIIILFILGLGLIGLIAYRIENPTQITSYIDGKMVEGLDSILDFQTDENGETKIYFPIREFAKYLNSSNPEFKYETYTGDYEPKTEEDNKCYVIRPNYEVAIFNEKSNIIYRVDLQDSKKTYEECYIDRDVFKSNNQLYTSVDGIEKGYNIYFEYNEAKKVIQIYTLDYLLSAHEAALANVSISDYGVMEIAKDNYSDGKAIFDDLLIVVSTSGKYGIISATDYTKFILEPQYDNIQFLANSSTFLVESNGKLGVFSKEGKRKIDLKYDEIVSMGQNSGLYLVSSNNLYGVVNENGDIIIYPEYEQIGIDVTPFSYNGVKNPYILLNKLIPVKQNEKWGFYNLQGEMVTKGFLYSKVGCDNIENLSNIYPLLEIPENDVIVIGDEYEKYSFMDSSGKDTMLPFVFDKIYIKLSSGQKNYLMKYNDKEYDVLKNLNNIKQ